VAAQRTSDDSPLRARHMLGVLLGIIVSGALLLGGLLLSIPRSDAAEPVDTGIPHPTAGIGEHTNPLGTPLAVTEHSDAYKYILTQSDGHTPVTWDPCRAIHYVTRVGNEPTGGPEVLDAALARISQVTGLQFVNDGSTDETLGPDRPVFQPDRYGDQWVPVLIQWSAPGENADFDATDAIVMAQTVPTPVRAAAGPNVYVTGQVNLSSAWFGLLLNDPTVTDGAVRAQAIMEHELGHLVGLDHIADPAQLMNSFSDQRDYQPGDLTGLAALGSGACAPSL
jgi:hypothetical protein